MIQGDHGHGRLVCKECNKMIQSCKCMGSGETVEYTICPACKSERALKTIQATQAFNQKLKDLGITIPRKKK